jgi:hypothetical protein
MIFFFFYFFFIFYDDDAATRKWEMCGFLVLVFLNFFWFVKGNVCVFGRY